MSGRRCWPPGCGSKCWPRPKATRWRWWNSLPRCPAMRAVQAAAELGTGADALAVAERAGLVAVERGRVVFRHPLARAAAYHGAPLAMRLAAHGALARALAGQPDPAGRRTWHLAEATSGKDEAVAAELERLAERSREQGGYAAVSAAYQRAGQLTSDPQVQARRLLAGATAANDAGQMVLAGRLASQAEELTTDPSLLAGLAYLRTTRWCAGMPGPRA